MKKFKKSLLIAGTAVSVGVGSLGMVSAVSAASDTSMSGTSIIDRLATKFGLNKADVQAVFNEERTAHQAEHLANLKEKLATAVSEGKLTQSQSDAITAKFTELQTQRETNMDKFKDMTDAERKMEMETRRTAFEKWMTDNNIPAEYARLIHMGGHSGPRGDMAPPINDN